MQLQIPISPRRRLRMMVTCVASLVGLAFVTVTGSEAPLGSAPDQLAFRIEPTPVVRSQSNGLDTLPLNEPIVLADGTAVNSAPTTATAPTTEQSPMVVSVDDAEPDPNVVPSTAWASASAIKQTAVTAGFIVFHPPSCGFEWFTDPAGNSWRVANVVPGSFELPEDWLPVAVSTEAVRLVASSADQGTILVRPEGASTAVEYRATPARIICHT